MAGDIPHRVTHLKEDTRHAVWGSRATPVFTRRRYPGPVTHLCRAGPLRPPPPSPPTSRSPPPASSPRRALFVTDSPRRLTPRRLCRAARHPVKPRQISNYSAMTPMRLVSVGWSAGRSAPDKWCRLIAQDANWLPGISIKSRLAVCGRGNQRSSKLGPADGWPPLTRAAGGQRHELTVRLRRGHTRLFHRASPTATPVLKANVSVTN